MKILVFDTESTSLEADKGIILCMCCKYIGEGEKIKTFSAGDYPAWDTKRSNSKPIVKDIIHELNQADILIAHNGQKHDIPLLNSFALKYNITPLTGKKLIDPVLLSRKKLRLGRNSLHSLISFFEVIEQKTQIDWKDWLSASLDGDRASLNRIVHHCKQDIITLEDVYTKIVKIVGNIDNKGSWF